MRVLLFFNIESFGLLRLSLAFLNMSASFFFAGNKIAIFLTGMYAIADAQNTEAFPAAAAHSRRPAAGKSTVGHKKDRLTAVFSICQERC